MIYLTKKLMVVAKLGQKGPIKLGALTRKLGIKKSSAYETLTRLSELGAIKHDVSGRAWRLTDEMIAQLKRRSGSKLSRFLDLKAADCLEASRECKRFVEFLIGFTDANGRSPTLTECADYFGVSKITIFERFKILDNKGIVGRIPRRWTSMFVRPKFEAKIRQFAAKLETAKAKK